MRGLAFLIVMLVAGSVYGQCPGGTCTPVRNRTVSVVKKIATVRPLVSTTVSKDVTRTRVTHRRGILRLRFWR